jgi:hypothetical protein
MHSDGRYERFIAQGGWKYVSHAYCLHWISTGRRCRCYDNKDHYAWMDHTSGYTRGDERMLLCQPYFLNDPETLTAAADKFNLEFGISGRGWYGHGTVTIELTPRGQSTREYERALERTREQVRERQLAAGAATVPPGIHKVDLDKLVTEWDED